MALNMSRHAAEFAEKAERSKAGAGEVSQDDS